MRLYFTIETQKGIRVTIIWAAVFVKQNILMDHSVRFLRETWENGWNHPFYVLTACRLPWYRHSFNQLSSVVCDENMIVVVLVPTLVTWTQIPESRVCWHAFTIREGSDQVHCIGLQPLIRIHCRFSAKGKSFHEPVFLSIFLFHQKIIKWKERNNRVIKPFVTRTSIVTSFTRFCLLSVGCVRHVSEHAYG